jgi:hypothetical protein
MLDVLLASIASGFAFFSSAREERTLGVDVLEDRLDDHVGARDAVARDVGQQPVARIARTARVLQAIGEAACSRASSRARGAPRLVLQRP